MSGFWEYINSNEANVSQVNALMQARQNPHELRFNHATGYKETPLSYLVSQDRTEEAYAILNHPHFVYADELAYFIHATLDRILNTDDPIFQTLINEKMKDELQLHEILNSFPTIDALIVHLEPVVRHVNRLDDAGRKIYLKKTRATRFLNTLLTMHEGGGIELEEGLDYDELMFYEENGETIRTTLLSMMIRKGMDAKALMILSKPNYQFVEGSLFALRAAVRMQKPELIALLVKALFNSRYKFSQIQITQNFNFFHEQRFDLIAIEMLNRAKDLYSLGPAAMSMGYKIAQSMKSNPDLKPEEREVYNRYIQCVEEDVTSPFNKLMDVNSEIPFSNVAVRKPLISSGLFLRHYAPIQQLEDNMSEPDSEYKKGAQFEL